MKTVRKVAFFLLVGAFFLAGCSPKASALSPSLDEKIAQMLMVGFRGTIVDENHFIVQDIKARKLGGVILFDYDIAERQPGRNIKSPAQVDALVASLQAASSAPLLIAIDQEGGRIARLKARDGFPPTVSHGFLGQVDDLEITSEHSAKLAKTLADLGIGLNLAPVVDLCVNPDNPVIAHYERCFSADPEKTTAHALRFIKAHHQAGVLTSLKHFPGHGSSTTDSHLGFTDISDTWSETELIPFRRLIAQGRADAVMTAHVFHARLDEQHPATLSSAVIGGLLREDLAFEGVVISDDMQMGAITQHYSFETAVHLAIKAGVDILVFGNNLDYDEKIVVRTIALIRGLVDSGSLSASRIDESYHRIQNLKRRL
ncbi:beta-N-acetylhexosaminidase [Geoalkalibacter ferrihydriticus]|uniref:Glycoside hydrolase family 3 n=2 Tax=Geoalkalibacter ferrihydriticus TaxID=392333 RepID=A0A0C2DVH3_9BACT|nr:glycoside hydrolase family 3 protein [Geoalkalibacter ferrihydriticus]KIH77439.1 glycoside hydrolase family 3 [Geoalkalibacter ferrihydriticus DSM 17813]SDM14969.1 beta-N-acetylhexosaminidase [Geoalkalibacter ferrihydriticus]